MSVFTPFRGRELRGAEPVSAEEQIRRARARVFGERIAS
jgi:hypothetical protein